MVTKYYPDLKQSGKHAKDMCNPVKQLERNTRRITEVRRPARKKFHE
jgi:hypothetical protein